MITVRWDTGGETSLVPGPGVLRVVTSRRRAPSAHSSDNLGRDGRGQEDERGRLTEWRGQEGRSWQEAGGQGTSSSRTTGKKKQ